MQRAPDFIAQAQPLHQQAVGRGGGVILRRQGEALGEEIRGVQLAAVGLTHHKSLGHQLAGDARRCVAQANAVHHQLHNPALTKHLVGESCRVRGARCNRVLCVVRKRDAVLHQGLALEDDDVTQAHLLGNSATPGDAAKNLISQGHAVAPHNCRAVGEHARQGHAVLGQRLQPMLHAVAQAQGALAQAAQLAHRVALQPQRVVHVVAVATH